MSGLSFSRMRKLTTTPGCLTPAAVPRGCDSDSDSDSARGVGVGSGVGVAAGRGARRDWARVLFTNANAQSARAEINASAKRSRGAETCRARTRPRVVDLFG